MHRKYPPGHPGGLVQHRADVDDIPYLLDILAHVRKAVRRICLMNDQKIVRPEVREHRLELRRRGSLPQGMDLREIDRPADCPHGMVQEHDRRCKVLSRRTRGSHGPAQNHSILGAHEPAGDLLELRIRFRLAIRIRNPKSEIDEPRSRTTSRRIAIAARYSCPAGT